jgi:hypothetical protein
MINHYSKQTLQQANRVPSVEALKQTGDSAQKSTNPNLQTASSRTG